MTPRDLTLPVWPLILAPRVQMFRQDAPEFFGPRPGIGKPQSVLADAGLWRLPLQLNLHGWRVLAVRTIIWRMQVENIPVYMPFWDMIRAPVIQTIPVPHVDDTPFDDGAEYEGSSLVATVDFAAAAGATALIAAYPAAVNFSAGQIIGIGERAYGIRSMEQLVGNRKTLYIWPKLREPLAVGDRIDLYNPLVRMRLDSRDASRALGELDRAIVGPINLEFIEDGWT